MFTERHALEDSLRNIDRRMDEMNKERMDLRAERKDILQRLREIDERDMKSNSIDLMESLSDKLTDALGTISKIIPSIPAATMIEHLQKEGTIKAEQVEPAQAEDPEPTEVQKAAQDQLLHMKPRKLSIEEAAAVIKKIIEEKGEGAIVSSQVIEYEFAQKTGQKYAAFSPKMTEAMEIFPSIKRVARGRFTIERKKKKSLLESIGNSEEKEKQLLEA
ncbi:hypothetical protein ACWA2C_28260 [Priestia megaterium]